MEASDVAKLGVIAVRDAESLAVAAWRGVAAAHQILLCQAQRDGGPVDASMGF